MRRAAVIALGLALAGMLGGCGGPESPALAIVNRSDAILTVGPGLIIPACGSTTTTLAGYETARTRAGELRASDEWWDAPDGAIAWTNLAIATSGGGPAGPMTIVVTSAADPAAWDGLVAERAIFPACGGRPRGIEPGTPVGEVPTVTPRPELPSEPAAGDAPRVITPADVTRAAWLRRRAAWHIVRATLTIYVP